MELSPSEDVDDAERIGVGDVLIPRQHLLGWERVGVLV